MTSSDAAILARASRLYYLEERNQQEIARLLGISRPGVSRLLSRARKEKIVEIRIRGDEAAGDWTAVAAAHGLRELHVARATAGETPKDAVGRLAARWFADTVPRGAAVGLTAGTTLSAFVAHVDCRPSLDLRIVPLAGSLWDTGEDFDGSFLCQELRRRTGGVHHVLSAPAIVATAAMARSLRAEPKVHAVLNEYDKLQVTMVGIGTADGEHPIVRAASGSTPQRRKPGPLPAAAVASIGGLFFDARGRLLRTTLDARTIGITHAALAAVPTRVGLAAGAAKAPAVRSVLRGGLVNVLFADEALANELGRPSKPEKARIHAP